MDSYNLRLSITLITLPFRKFEFIEDDIYALYCMKKISYEQFVDRIFLLVNQEFNIKDMDEFILMVEDIFPKNNKKKTLIEVKNFYLEKIKKMAESLLLIMNQKVYLNQNYINTKNDLFSVYHYNQKIIIWYFLSRYVDTSFLIIYHLYRCVGCIDEFIHNDSGIHVHVLNNYQQNLFKEGLYETHVHFGGAISFNVQWWSLVGKRPFTLQKENEIRNINKINSVVSGYFDHSLWVLASIAVRYIMMRMIFCFENQTVFKQLDQGKRIKEKYGLLLDKYASGKLSKDDIIFIKNIITDIENEIKILSDNIDYSDYIGIFIGKENEIQSENVFIFHCFRYLNNENDNQKINIFIQCFFNYLKIKNSVFALKVQTNAIRGLSYFGEFYHANSNYCLNAHEKFDIVMNHYYHQENIKGIELKISQLRSKVMDELVGSYQKSVLKYIDFYKEWLENNTHHQRLMKLGFILLFKKYKYNQNICYKNYIIEKDRQYLKYGKVQQDMMSTILALQHLRNKVDGLEKIMIGIDAAGNENNCEPCVFAPIYRMVKNPYHEVIEETDDPDLQAMYRRYQIFPIKDLGLTYHVGEVFSTIVSGLRHIDEVMTYFGYIEGDRIGHGLALAIDIKRYLRDKKVIRIKKIDYLQNLIWIYSLVSTQEITIQFDIEVLKKKIIDVFRSIFSPDDESLVNILTLVDYYCYQFHSIDKKLRKLKTKDCYFNEVCLTNSFHHNEEWTLEQLLAADHCRYFNDRMNESILISESLDDEIFYTCLQQYVRNKVAKKGIIVEINPVSNSLIGDIDDITLLPYLNLDTIGFNTDQSKNVLITVNTDDPAVFNTDLLYQYALLETQFTQMGYSKKVINQWLDFVRRNSHYSTFIHGDYQSIEHLKDELQKIENNLKKM